MGKYGEDSAGSDKEKKTQAKSRGSASRRTYARRQPYLGSPLASAAWLATTHSRTLTRVMANRSEALPSEIVDAFMLVKARRGRVINTY